MIEGSSRKTVGVAVATILALAACGDDPLGPEPDDVEFAPSLSIDLASMTETASGLFFQDDMVGTGDDVAAAGDSATVAFSLWLADATALGNGVFPFILGMGEAIDGFDEGVTGMRVGGQRTIVIPASLGYGSSGTGDGEIPGDAVLVYVVSVTAIRKAPF